MIVTWLLIVVCTGITLVELVWVSRHIIRSFKDMRIQEQQKQEEEREWKVQRHNFQSTILQGEEWEVDVSSLKTIVAILDRLRKANRALHYEEGLIVTAWMPFFVVLALVWFIPMTLAFWLAGLTFAVALLWSVYHLWKWFRIRHIVRQLTSYADMVGETA